MSQRKVLDTFFIPPTLLSLHYKVYFELHIKLVLVGNAVRAFHMTRHTGVHRACSR